MRLSLILIIFLLLTSIFSFAQQIKNVDFTVDNSFIIVTYDLINCPSKENYDIKLEIINNNKTIKPKSIVGDFKNVKSGVHKTIKWDVLSDEPELKGEIQVIVNISKSYTTKIVGGPSNAFLSAVVPGVGYYFVTKNENTTWEWYYTTGLFLTSAYLTYSFKQESDNFYNQYYNATTQFDMDAAYDEANSYYQSYQLMMGVTAAIYLGDILYVTIKGFTNRAAQRNRYANRFERPSFYFYAMKDNYQIGFVKRF